MTQARHKDCRHGNTQHLAVWGETRVGLGNPPRGSRNCDGFGALSTRISRASTEVPSVIWSLAWACGLRW